MGQFIYRNFLVLYQDPYCFANCLHKVRFQYSVVCARLNQNQYQSQQVRPVNPVSPVNPVNPCCQSIMLRRLCSVWSYIDGKIQLLNSKYKNALRNSKKSFHKARMQSKNAECKSGMRNCR